MSGGKWSPQAMKAARKRLNVTGGSPVERDVAKLALGAITEIERLQGVVATMQAQAESNAALSSEPVVELPVAPSAPGSMDDLDVLIDSVKSMAADAVVNAMMNGRGCGLDQHEWLLRLIRDLPAVQSALAELRLRRRVSSNPDPNWVVLYWRGSVTDLATDLCAALKDSDLRELQTLLDGGKYDRAVEAMRAGDEALDAWASGQLPRDISPLANSFWDLAMPILEAEVKKGSGR